MNLLDVKNLILCTFRIFEQEVWHTWFGFLLFQKFPEFSIEEWTVLRAANSSFEVILSVATKDQSSDIAKGANREGTWNGNS